ncbi:hypothetical protein ABIA33_005610 [Streptacidiphilus sp. MAP12-16]
MLRLRGHGLRHWELRRESYQRPDDLAAVSWMPSPPLAELPDEQKPPAVLAEHLRGPADRDGASSVVHFHQQVGTAGPNAEPHSFPGGRGGDGVGNQLGNHQLQIAEHIRRTASAVVLPNQTTSPLGRHWFSWKLTTQRRDSGRRLEGHHRDGCSEARDRTVCWNDDHLLLALSRADPERRLDSTAAAFLLCDHTVDVPALLRTPEPQEGTPLGRPADVPGASKTMPVDWYRIGRLQTPTQ